MLRSRTPLSQAMSIFIRTLSWPPIGGEHRAETACGLSPDVFSPGDLILRQPFMDILQILIEVLSRP